MLHTAIKRALELAYDERETCRDGDKARGLALVITKLEEAQLWLGTIHTPETSF